MSRYFMPEKSNERHSAVEKPKIDVKSKPKIKKKFDISLDDDDNLFDPHHGPAPIPIEVLQKYQRGKRLDAVSSKSF